MKFSDLSNVNQKNVKTWHNNVEDIKSSLNDLKWVFDNNKKIGKYIKDNYDNNNTLSSHYSTLSLIIKEYEDDDIAEKFRDLSVKHKKIVDKEYDKQEPKENQIDFDDIVDKRKEYKKIYLENKTKKNIMFKYLILALYTYQAPLRADYADMEIYNKNPPKNNKNYIWKKNNKWIIVINNDKVSDTYGRGEIEIESIQLNKLINETIEQYDRKYLLSLITDPNKPLGKQNFIRLLNEIFKPEKIGVQIFRSAYITNKYSNKKFTIEDKKKLALMMRHSYEIASHAYHKITGTNKEENKRGPKIKNDDEDKKKEAKKKYNKKYRDKNLNIYNEHSKKYYAENKDEVLRKKALSYYNKGNKKPTKKTIEKYNLKYDKRSKSWK